MVIFQKQESGQLSAAQQKKIRNRNRACTRAAIQALFFVSMPGAFVAGFNGIKYVFRQMAGGGMLETNSFLMALAGLAVFTILFGRYFCGYVCSFGALGDFVYWMSGVFQRKILRKKKQMSVPQPVLPYLQKLKYFNLVFILIMTATGSMAALQGTSPWDVFSLLTAFRTPDKTYLVGILSLAAILAGMAVQSRFFCQFLCPMGAFFAILPVFPFAALKRDSENCIKGCSACQKMCPVGLKLKTDGFRNGECVLCETCTGICPKGNIHYPVNAVIKNEILSALLRAALFFALGAWLGLCRFL